MFGFLFQMHEIYLFVLLGIVSITISVIAMYLVKWLVPIKLRYADNAVLGNMSAMISIIYGVLAGLTALYLINNISDTTNAVQREASAIANIYRDSRWLNDPVRTKVQAEIKAYLERVINIEWPLMKEGQDIGNDGDLNIDRISEDLSKYNVVGNTQMLIMQSLLAEIKLLYNARQERILASGSELNPEIWVVILLGTFLTLLINYLFGMHFYLHLVTVSAATLMAFSMVFLLVTLDRPFQGEYVIEADAFKPVLTYINNHSA